VIATDVAAGGLDVEQLTHVVNYHLPSAPEACVHWIGRVGRAGREGAAITLAEPREHRMLKTIEKLTGQRVAVEKVPTCTWCDVGTIEIANRFSLVEVPESAANEVVAALRRSTIKGKKATVRRERGASGGVGRLRSGRDRT
jgi:superfamily II DNA/RNA helicase